MKAKVYIDRLFEGYEDTPELKDFKEEIAINLQGRMKELMKKGLSSDDAFEKAVAELGDITEIADQISRQKRNEVISKMYINTKTTVDKMHAIGYAISGGVALFGIIAALITYFSNGAIFTGIAALLPFIVLSGSAFVFLGLTQETARNHPMQWKRATLYAIATGLILFGLSVSSMLFFMQERELAAVLGTLIPFVIPGICLLAFLLLTEKKGISHGYWKNKKCGWKTIQSNIATQS